MPACRPTIYSCTATPHRAVKKAKLIPVLFMNAKSHIGHQRPRKTATVKLKGFLESYDRQKCRGSNMKVRQRTESRATRWGSQSSSPKVRAMRRACRDQSRYFESNQARGIGPPRRTRPRDWNNRNIRARRAPSATVNSIKGATGVPIVPRS